MCNRSKCFLDKHSILYRHQYGFREKCSTQYALIDIINRIQLNIDKKLFSWGIFIELKKVLDTVNHSILLQKLQRYGIRGVVNIKLLRSALTYPRKSVVSMASHEDQS